MSKLVVVAKQGFMTNLAFVGKKNNFPSAFLGSWLKLPPHNKSLTGEKKNKNKNRSLMIYTHHVQHRRYPGRLLEMAHATTSSLQLKTKEGFPGGTSGKEPACQCRKHKRCKLDPWVGKIP